MCHFVPDSVLPLRELDSELVKCPLAFYNTSPTTAKTITVINRVTDEQPLCGATIYILNCSSSVCRMIQISPQMLLTDQSKSKTPNPNHTVNPNPNHSANPNPNHSANPFHANFTGIHGVLPASTRQIGHLLSPRR